MVILLRPVTHVFRRYIASVRRCNCGELRGTDATKRQNVILAGWLQYQRLSGKIFTLRDSYGVTQILVPDNMNSLAHLIETSPLESIVEVTGKVLQRPTGMENKKMLTGDIEVHAECIEILNKCSLSPPPFQVSRAPSVNELLRLQYRYIDLRSSEMQEAIRLRSKFLFHVRNFFIGQHNFVEVETPYLFRKTPAGAREFVVPTRNLGNYFCLPQSPQQFKQVLMAGAVDRYIQIARCFRDESARADRQPEFTQIDIEMAYADEHKIRSLVERCIVAAWASFSNSAAATSSTSPSLPFPRLTYERVMTDYGSDKPDMRFEWKIRSLAANTSLGQDYNFMAFDGCYRFFTGNEGKKALQDLEQTVAQKYPDSVIYICKLVKKVGKVKSVSTRHLPKYVMTELEKCLEVGDEDGLVAVVPSSTESSADTRLWLGHIRHFLGAVCEKHGWPPELDYKNTFKFLWVEDFPMFVPASSSDSDTVQSEIGLECGHHPFTAPHPDDVELFKNCLFPSSPSAAIDAKKLLDVRSRQYDLVLNGHEVGGGSVRIHDSETQRRVLVDVLNHKAEHFDFFLQALASGCPPHAGIALGVERLLAVLMHKPSVREVMAFPKSSEGRDLMTGAPCSLSAEDLKIYGQQKHTS